MIQLRKTCRRPCGLREAERRYYLKTGTLGDISVIS